MLPSRPSWRSRPDRVRVVLQCRRSLCPLIQPRRAQPSYISRHDLLDRFGLDAEFPETRQGSACHVIRLEQVNLAGGERAWQELKQPRLNLGHRVGQGDEQLPSADETERED